MIPGERFGLFLLLLVLVPTGAVAQPGAELTSFGVLRLEPSARSTALGGAYAAMADGDVNVIFFNPAATGPATSHRVAFSYLNHLSDLNVGSVAYSQRLSGAKMTISGGLRFAHWGTFEGRDRYGNRTGDFGAGDAVLTTSVSRSAGDGLRYGGSVHLMHARIDDAQAYAVGVDVGGLYRISSHALTLGATLRNVGVTLDGFGGTRENLPLDLQLGLTKELAHLPLLLTATAYDLTNLSDGLRGGGTLDHVLGHMTFGAELRPVDILRVRVGYNHRRSHELALSDRFDFAGFGVGFGVTIRGLTVDYAYNSWSSLGGLHQFSLRTDFKAWTN